jgi:hypothetical protein
MRYGGRMLHGLTMTKVFKAETEAEVKAKADVWVASQKGLKNIQRHTYVFRAPFLKDGPKSAGDWTVTLHYDQEL